MCAASLRDTCRGRCGGRTKHASAHGSTGYPIHCALQKFSPQPSFLAHLPPPGATDPAATPDGVSFVDDVEPYENMKVSCLNGPHLGVGYAGALLEMTYAHDSAQDDAISAFLKAYIAEEARPTVRGVPDAALEAFTEGVVPRFQNAAMADGIDRLTSNTPGRAIQFLVPVVRANLEAGRGVRGAAAICAMWARFTEQFVAKGGERSEVGGDELTLALDEHMKSAKGDDLALLKFDKVFGGLVDESRFTEPFVAQLRALRDTGDVRTVLKGAYDGS